MTLCYVIFTFLCTFSACYAMRSVMSQINEYDDDDDHSLRVTFLLHIYGSECPLCANVLVRNSHTHYN